MPPYCHSTVTSGSSNQKGIAFRRRAELANALLKTGQKDHQAFEHVYLLTRAKLLSVCQRICCDPSTAEDVIHEVYAAVWLSAHRFDAERGTAMTWLMTIAYNRSVDRCRTDARHSPALVLELHNDVGPSASAEQVMLAAQEAALLRACLDTLDSRTQRSIRSAFFDGMTYAQLAARENIPLSSMKSLIRRGLGKLRKLIVEEPEQWVPNEAAA